MDYQSNSHKNAEKNTPKKQLPEKKVEKIISGEVVHKKKPLGRRFKEVFFGGEFSNAARYIAADVLLPALRNLVVDSVEMGIKRMVYGDSMGRRRSTQNEYRPRVQYNNPIARNRDPRDSVYIPDQPPHPYRQNRAEANEIIISSREEAMAVLERLMDITDNYDVASLADLYDLVGLPSSHTDNKWGWTNLANVEIRQVREGYLLVLPIMEPI